MISEKIARFRERHMMTIALCVMIAGMLFAFFSPRILVIVPAGSAAVLFRPFSGGTDLKEVLGEGMHVVLPWNDVEMYDLRLQTLDDPMNLITKDGLAVEARITSRFRVNREHLGTLHQNVGRNYIKVMLAPEVAATAREIVSTYEAEELHSVKRGLVQRQILEKLRADILASNKYSPGGISLVDIDDVLIKNVALPPIVAAAIERKVEQYHKQLELDYRIQTETKEATRREIEGEGVRKMFDAVGARDLQAYLRLAGINAMLQLAQSPNSKVVVLGESKGVPVIVDPESRTSAAGVSPAPLTARKPPAAAAPAAPAAPAASPAPDKK